MKEIKKMRNEWEKDRIVVMIVRHKYQLDGNERISKGDWGTGRKQRGSGIPQPQLYLFWCATFMHHPESSMSALSPLEIN